MSSTAPLDTAGDAARPRSGILTPSSEGSLHHQNGVSFSPENRKRKQTGSVAMDQLLKPSIALKPHPPSLHIPPRVLQPLMLLPREHLPLACLDFSGSNDDLHRSRVFESHIRILDLENRMGSGPTVLIARNETRGKEYAIERQENGLYVVCMLGAWVDLQTLARNATVLLPERVRPVKVERSEQPGISALTTPQLHLDHKKKKAAIEAIQSLVKRRASSQSAYNFDEAISHDPGTEPGFQETQTSSLKSELEPRTRPSIHHNEQLPLPTPGASTTEAAGTQHTAEDILDNIRSHYFEALYRSKGSLAYFAKGPLSRARSAYHLDLEADLDMADLIEFLKSLILTTVQIDKKYREAIPEVVSKLKSYVDSSDEGRKRKRKPKKMKIGKDGLYPAEDEDIQKWWCSNLMDMKENEADLSTAQIKSHVSLLRTRETQLQMILIMEILALEPLKAAEETGESNLPALPGAGDLRHHNLTPTSQPKKRNKHNLPVLIDVHADRLTIWQSTASDEQLLLEDSQVITQPSTGPQQKASSEPLKDFCVDVIVPFFAARLPELCDSINRKLGGPVTISQSKSKSLKRSSSMRDQKPGTPAKRPALLSSGRTLQRALSTELQHRRSVSRGPGNFIALMRSASSTTVAGIKREGGEMNGHKISKGESSEAQNRRVLLSRSSSMANLQDVKASKQAQVDAELKDAISALRKPNRDVVGKALTEAEERRISKVSLAKKVKKISRSSLGSGIQVKATPTNTRFKDMLPAKSGGTPDSVLGTMEDVIPPSSIGRFVPSTAQRSTHKDMLHAGTSSTLELVGGTPTKSMPRPSFIRRPADEEPAIPPYSPIMERNNMRSGPSYVSESVLKSQQDLVYSTARAEDIMETPVKKSMQRVRHEEGSGGIPVQEEKKRSIFERLGWDDDLDDL